MKTFEISSCGAAVRFEASSYADAMVIAKSKGFFTSDKQESEFFSKGSCVRFERIKGKWVAFTRFADVTNEVIAQSRIDSKAALLRWKNSSTANIYANLFFSGDHCCHVMAAYENTGK